MSRLEVTKTYKLYIGGKFPRTESGRSTTVSHRDHTVVAHTCRGSRKDLRNAVEAAAKAQPGWSGANAYLRGQILYRMAEMVEGKRTELGAAIASLGGASEAEALSEVDQATDRLVTYAGWADKFPQIIGCHNPVTGPYYNFSVPEPTGIVGVVAPDDRPLAGLIDLISPVICSGNAVVALASEANPIPACVFAEALATSDLPGGVVNILTGYREELLGHFASHREINGLSASGLDREERATLERGVAENLKRVRITDANEVSTDPWSIEAFVEVKTIWHPSSA